MKTINFTSSLSHEMTHFVKLKQLSGSAYYSSAKLLFRFDQYLTAISFKSKALAKPIFEKYFTKLENGATASNW